jgi:tetratricopeptide (TPR) repeat protein
MGKISLCVIAKDEEQLLPGLLASVQGSVDEIILVDTGSQDRTVQIATQAGARVFHHVWQDDFAVARNQAVKEATGDWILVLDCDERLAPGFGHALREAIQRDDFDLGMLPLYNATHVDATPEDILSGAALKGAPVLLPRLLRCDPSLRWTGRVHESVSEWVKEGPKRISPVSVAILHLGYAPDVVESKNKSDRNLRLLQRRCEEDPNNSVVWSHLARVHFNLGDLDSAWDAATMGWEALVRTVEAGDFSQEASPLVTVIAFMALKKDDDALALEVLERAAEWGVDHPNLQLLRGACHVARVLKEEVEPEVALEQAVECFAQAIKMGDRVWTEECMPGATTWAAWTRIGSVRLLQDRWEEAYAAFAQALSYKADHIEAALGLVESQLGLNDSSAALETVESLLQVNLADPWILAAFASRNLGQIDDCHLFLRLANEKMADGIMAPHRRKYLRMLQQDLAAMAV